MNRDRVEKLKVLVGPDEQAELAVLYNAYVNTLNRYQGAPDRPADLLKANRAAKEALVELVEQLEQRYLSGARRLANGMAALSYLQDKGWKIKKSRLYGDKNKGLIHFNSDKSVDEVELLAYAAMHLGKIRSEGPGDDIGKISEKKLKEEARKVRLQAEKLQYELDIIKRKYIHRNRWLAELVGKMRAIKEAAILVVRHRAPDVITAVGGDLKKQSLYVDLMIAYLEDAYDELSNVKEIKLLISRSEKANHDSDG
jgi:hypothetical protein